MHDLSLPSFNFPSGLYVVFLLQALEELNGQELLNRPVKLDLARERGAYTPVARYGAISCICFENNPLLFRGRIGVTFAPLQRQLLFPEGWQKPGINSIC